VAARRSNLRRRCRVCLVAHSGDSRH